MKNNIFEIKTEDGKDIIIIFERDKNKVEVFESRPVTDGECISYELFAVGDVQV